MWLKIIFLFSLIFLTGCQADLPLNINNSGNNTNFDSVATSSQPIATSTKPIVDKQPSSTPEVKPLPSLPTSLLLDVPFTSQAPYSVWDAVHGEACEEASMIMVNAYLKHQNLTQAVAEQKILDLIKWETEKNYSVDLSISEVKAVLEDYFNLSGQVITQPTVDKIKTELAAGRLVIIPAAGRELGNPNFHQPGPIYHMLVVRGYNQTSFITNDPGTRNGKGYVYSYQILLNAIHDWNHQYESDGMTDAEMDLGSKIILSVSK